MEIEADQLSPGQQIAGLQRCPHTLTYALFYVCAEQGHGFRVIRDLQATGFQQDQHRYGYVGAISSQPASGQLLKKNPLYAADLNAPTADLSSLYKAIFIPGGYALYYNTELVPEPPTTIEGLTAICDELTDIENCWAVPGGGDAADPYHNFSFISALGGYIFGFDPGTGYDTTDIGLDNEGAVSKSDLNYDGGVSDVWSNRLVVQADSAGQLLTNLLMKSETPPPESARRARRQRPWRV